MELYGPSGVVGARNALGDHRPQVPNYQGGELPNPCSIECDAWCVEGYVHSINGEVTRK
jgi:hypothetical protein